MQFRSFDDSWQPFLAGHQVVLRVHLAAPFPHYGLGRSGAQFILPCSLWFSSFVVTGNGHGQLLSTVIVSRNLIRAGHTGRPSLPRNPIIGAPRPFTVSVTVSPPTRMGEPSLVPDARYERSDPAHGPPVMAITGIRCRSAA